MIRVNDISFGYAQEKILKDISFDIERGDCIAVLGNNGAGKSTLIKCLNKILKPDSGFVEIDGLNITNAHRNTLAKNIAYVAQKNEVSRFTVFDCVLLGRKPYIKWDSSNEDLKIAEDAIDLLGLSDYKMRYVDELSGGELQKVMIARALTQKPKLLLLDEPTSNLDPKNQYSVLRLLKRIAHEQNIAVIVVIHDLNLALRYCDRFLFIKDSRIYSYGDISSMTSECLEEVYDMCIDVIEYNGFKIAVPCPHRH